MTFQEGRGAPAKATFEKLISWPDHEDKGIKYFSGTATYRKTINIPADRFGENRSLLLDLGSVKEIAEVRLNGQDLGILWKAPFRVDITKAAKAGRQRVGGPRDEPLAESPHRRRAVSRRLPMGRHPSEAVARVDAEGRAAAR